MSAKFNRLLTPEVIATVQALIDDGLAKDRRIQAWDEIKLVLLQHNLAWRSQEAPDWVGVHTSNRSKFGVDALKVHAHMAKIKKAGFSWSKCSDVVCIEVGAAATEIAAFTDHIAQLSNGMLPMLSQPPKLANLGGGHTNFGLRAIVHGCKTSLTGLGDGKLDQGRMCQLYAYILLFYNAELHNLI